MKKEKRFTEHDNDKKVELAIRSALLIITSVLVIVWSVITHINEQSFVGGIVFALCLVCYCLCTLSYTYGKIEIGSNGIYYQSVFLVKKQISWSEIGEIYKAEAVFNGTVPVSIICCTIGKTKKKLLFRFNTFSEKSYFLMGYSEERLQRVNSYFLENREANGQQGNI